MTELEQKLLYELERYEAERKQELQTIKISFKSLAEQVAVEIGKLAKKTHNEQLGLLRTIADQQTTIIELLKKPPSGDSLQEQLQMLGEQLSEAYHQSNQYMVREIKELLA